MPGGDAKPVSYTHLDVYKRQLLPITSVNGNYSPRVMRIRREGSTKRVTVGYLDPVSYTHLDVYKRQHLRPSSAP